MLHQLLHFAAILSVIMLGVVTLIVMLLSATAPL
jgi:hypothetical protein